jgi:NAD(P)-dependent dehydrogenase (short-subunit alcohol dehydrogenase family)
MSQLDGKVALVSGGGRGIGRAVALALAEAGASVAVMGRNMNNLEETCSAIAGGLPIACDVMDSTSVQAAFGKIRETLGAVDILVNNAGVTFSAKLHETPDDTWERIIQTNVNGTFYCCKAALPEMIRKRWGRIIVLASLAGTAGMPYSAAYSASKHAQLGLVRSLALEVTRHNIAVNAICPAWVETDMFDDIVATLVKTTGRTSEQARAELLKISGQARPVTPQEVAAEVLRLAVQEDAALTGQAIPIL